MITSSAAPGPLTPSPACHPATRRNQRLCRGPGFDAADQYPDGSIGYDFNLGGGDYVSIGVHIPETGYDAAIIADTPSEVQSNGSTIYRSIGEIGMYVSAAVLFPGVQCDVSVDYLGQATDQWESDVKAIASSLVVVATPN